MEREEQKIEIEMIEDETERRETFTRECKDLFEKAKDLESFPGTKCTVIAFSPGGTPHVYDTTGCAIFDKVISSTEKGSSSKAGGVFAPDDSEDIKYWRGRLDAIVGKDFERAGFADLIVIKRNLEELRAEVAKKLKSEKNSKHRARP